MMQTGSLVAQKSKIATFTKDILLIFMGSFLFTLAARASIFLPGTPVPISLQTFGVFMLGSFLGPRRAPLAIICYLIQATLGFCVLAGEGYNPLWMIGPRCGYLIGFVFATYVVGKLTENKSRSAPFLLVTFILGNLCLYLPGILVLSFFVGIKASLACGLYPFVIGEIYKLFAATCIAKGCSKAFFLRKILFDS